MKKSILLLSSLILTLTTQAQDRPQPKPGPAPTINLKKPETFTLPNGLKVLIVEDHKLPRVSYSLSIDVAPYAEGEIKGVSDLMSAMLGDGTTKTPKDKFNEEIDFLGANINFYSSGASASGLSKHSTRILELMAEGALMPNFTIEELEKNRERLIDGLKADEKSVSAVASRVENVLAYGKNHPAGEYLTEETIKKVSLADVKNNYRTYFVPQNAYLVIIGDIKTKEIKKTVEKLFGSWVKATAPNLTYSSPSNVQYSQINFVDMPNAVQSEIILMNNIELKVSNPDYFPLLIANQVFGGDFNSYLNMNLREAHGWTYGARSYVGSSKYISSKFVASTQVRNAVTDSAIIESLKELKKIRTERVSDEMLNNVKAGYIGRFVMQVEKPSTVARYAVNILTEGLPANFYENYIKNINAVTPEDIQRVAQKYMLQDNLRILVVGKATEVLPGLEKTKIPIFYFDKFGNPTEKPASKKPVPAGITVKSVIDNYINAIGGQKAISTVKSISSIGSTSIPQVPMPISYISKIDDKGKMFVELSVAGMGSLMKQVVNGDKSYISQQGQKMTLDAKAIEKMKENAVLFAETKLANKKEVTITAIEPINGNDAYVVVDGDKTHYFDVNSGLLIATSNEIEQEGQKMTQTTYFSDYKDVKGVKYPHQVSMNVGIELDIKMSEIKINEGITADELK
jgi:zinc protease